MKKWLVCLMVLMCLLSLSSALGEGESTIQEKLIIAEDDASKEKSGVKISSLDSDQSVSVLGVESEPVLANYAGFEASFLGFSRKTSRWHCPSVSLCFQMVAGYACA